MRLLICDERRLFVDALTPILTAHGHTVVATALDPEEAVEAAREHHPDVCLLELSSALGHDLTAIARIHKVSPGTKVVVLSVSIDRELVLDAIAQGAQGLVGKAESIENLIEAMVLAHQGYLAVEPLLLLDAFRPHARNDDLARALDLLTGREREVLHDITDGLSTKEMADQLGVRLSTARAHVHNVLTKLGVHSRLQAAALMNTHPSQASRPNLAIAVDMAAAGDEPVAEAVRMTSRDWSAKPGAIESLLEAPLEAGAASEEGEPLAARSTRGVVSISGQGKTSKPGAKIIAKLTPRELEILRYMSEGLTGSQIAALLHVTSTTVRTHRRNIRFKLNADSALTVTALPRRA